MINLDIHFMNEALKEARLAYHEEEVPIGAILVIDGIIIARGHNQVEKLNDATAHAEILCIGAGAQAINNWRLENSTLYCTVEPCTMCIGAILLSRISRLVWGACDIRQGANGSWIDVLEKKHPIHTLEVTKKILEEECSQYLKDFFKKTRTSKQKCLFGKNTY